MKKVTWIASVAVILTSMAHFASANIEVSGPGFSFTVGGSGTWVCSAKDSFKNLPFLGRGDSREEAEAVAQALAADGGNGFFVKIEQCEETASGAGGISVSGDEQRGISIIAEGSNQWTCIAKDTFKNIPFISKAGTQTEAQALSERACTEHTSNNGFFCKAECNEASTGGANLNFFGFHLHVGGRN